jgi:hypothetical protein
MRDIICCGGSNTSYRIADKNIFYKGKLPTPGMDECLLGSYPDVIQRNFGCKVYNLGVMSNSVQPSVLSIISFASKLLNEGNTNFSIIFNCSDWYRQSFYFSKNTRQIKGIKSKLNNPVLNNYLFSDDESGFLLFGGVQNVSDSAYDDPKCVKIAKAYSENLFSFEECEIKAITHLLLLQNFCKLHNIPYKIFFDFDFLSYPFSPFFELNKKNEDTYFQSYFIDRKFPIKESLGVVKRDEYVYDLFKMLDLDGFWFYKDTNLEYGGIHEWIFKNNEYKEGDSKYTAFFYEDTELTPKEMLDKPIRISIQKAKEKMKHGTFFDTAHPTYYYWEKFVKEVVVNWNLF